MPFVIPISQSRSVASFPVAFPLFCRQSLLKMLPRCAMVDPLLLCLWTCVTLQRWITVSEPWPKICPWRSHDDRVKCKLVRLEGSTENTFRCSSTFTSVSSNMFNTGPWTKCIISKRPPSAQLWLFPCGCVFVAVTWQPGHILASSRPLSLARHWWSACQPTNYSDQHLWAQTGTFSRHRSETWSVVGRLKRFGVRYGKLRMWAFQTRLKASQKFIPSLVLLLWVIFTSSKSLIGVCFIMPRKLIRLQRMLRPSWKALLFLCGFHCACLVFCSYYIFDHILTSSRAACTISHGCRAPLFMYRSPWVHCVYHSFPALCLHEANGDLLLWLDQICCFDDWLCKPTK